MSHPTLPSPASASALGLLPGYEIEQSIGSGGFGEVFAALAPGGIRKAVKFVFGRLDESRAEQELKSLLRVKEVRHPFVISIDRIELVNDQLIIVTELADRSLRDRFEEAQGQRLPGVPREELLAYLADAADALDFLSEKHGLQHLDIKPENLLLLGDHCKVADFGLLKDLRDDSPSLMGGVTPNYAPPEVLEGQPDKRSDQYALAIVYQEMLTGVSPFNGRTAGQLASQHLHSPPDLTALTTADRYAVGKALAKTPSRRFDSCRAMIEAIRNPPQSALAKAPSVQRKLADARDNASRRAAAASSNSPLLRAELRSPVVRAPEPIEPGQPARPTVVIGLGGLGCEAVRRLRRDLTRELGTADLPAVQLLAIDSDESAIAALRRGRERDNADSLQPHETLHVPLRTPAEYRDNKEAYLGWLSRRWLYNVPRSLCTEGIRPLGRLALIDHVGVIRRRLGELFDDVLRREAGSMTTAATAVPFADGPPQVLLVGSTTGGQSSGSLIDLAYLTGELMRERSIEGKPDGVLLHAVPGAADRRDLATVNAATLLGELIHYTTKDETGRCHYPGDGSGRVGGIDGTTHQPLASASLLDCPPAWNDRDDPSHPAETAAAYLMQNIFGSTGAFLQRARAADQGGRFTLRNVGLLRLGGGRAAVAGEADAITRRVLQSWAEACRDSSRESSRLGNDIEHGQEQRQTVALIDGLNLEAIDTPAMQAAIDAVLDELAPFITHLVDGAAHVPREKLFTVLYKHIGMAAGSLEQVNTLRATFQAELKERHAGHVATLRRQMFTPEPAGYATIDDIQRRMYHIAAVLTERLQTVQRTAQRFRATCDDVQRGNRPIGESLLRDCIRGRLQSQIACFMAEAIQELITSVLDTGQLFDAAAPVLGQLAERVPMSPESPSLPEDQLNAIADQATAGLQKKLGTYWLMKLIGADGQSAVLEAVRAAAQEAIRQRSIGGLDAAGAIAGAAARFSDAAGSIRWLASGPTDYAAHAFDEALEAAHGQRPSVARTIGSDTILCCEAGDLPIASVTASLLGNRIDLVQTVSQLKSRTDVPWGF